MDTETIATPMASAQPQPAGLTPPFELDGVRTWILPLPADPSRLTELCARLGTSPDAACTLQPVLPLVYMVLVDYRRQSPRDARWVPRFELAFVVPLAWYRRRPRRVIFGGWTCFSPFLFVDAEQPARAWRAAFGWPATPARFERKSPVNAWQATARPPWLALSAQIPRRGNHQEATERVTLEIRWTPDHAAQPAALARSFLESLSLGWDLTGKWLRLGLFGDRELRSPGNLSAMLARPIRDTLARCLAIDNFGTIGNAMVNTRVRVRRLNRWSLLGAPSLATPAGGFRVTLLESGGQSIANTLGLVQSRPRPGSDPAASMVEVEPICPFCLDVDLTCDRGQVMSRAPTGADGAEEEI